MTTSERTRIAAVGALALAATITACGSDATPAATKSPSSSASASATAAAPAPAVPSAPPPPLPDADQIRQTLTAYQDAYNTQNWAAYMELLCQPMREQFNGPAMDLLKKTRADNGIAQVIGVSDVVVDGVKATAKVDVQNAVLGRLKLDFKMAQDQDGWKVCMPAGG
jgi:hypothetical protein